MGRFSGKGIIITGGTSGIGQATVTKFLDEGAKVVIADLNEASIPSNATFMKCDVSSFEEVERLIKEGNAWLESQDVKLDILFNNAGIGSFGETPDITVEHWKQVIETDLSSIFYGCKIAIPIMRTNGGGVIVNTASISGMFGDYGFGAYNAAKGAVINYTRSLAMDHGKDNIRVNALCPGVIKSGLTAGIEQATELLSHWESLIPLGRIGQAEEMANVVAFLASDDASYITGAAIAADGGMTARTGQPNFVNFSGG